VIPVNVIEISFSGARGELSSPNELPVTILDTGVWQVTTAQALRERGYGVTLVEAAAYGKARVRHATHVYTNADIERLHSGS
jgi:ribosomal protein L3